MCRSLYFQEAVAAADENFLNKHSNLGQISVSSKDDDAPKIIEFDLNGHYWPHSRKIYQDNCRPHLFNGFLRDGWEDSDKAAWLLAARYGAREHSVTVAGRMALRRRQMHNQSALKVNTSFEFPTLSFCILCHIFMPSPEHGRFVFEVYLSLICFYAVWAHFFYSHFISFFNY